MKFHEENFHHQTFLEDKVCLNWSVQIRYNNAYANFSAILY